MKKFLNEFKKFALRGNVIDLAVGVIIGGAFTGVVNAVSDNFIKPIINIFTAGGVGNLTVGEYVSSFISVLINFVITAFVLFLIIKGINSLMSIGKKPEAPAAPTTKKCPYCKTDIAIDATRCPHCTSVLEE